MKRAFHISLGFSVVALVIGIAAAWAPNRELESNLMATAFIVGFPAFIAALLCGLLSTEDF
jgi:uncharacterized membrane protein YozB (DUF420 family)